MGPIQWWIQGGAGKGAPSRSNFLRFHVVFVKILGWHPTFGVGTALDALCNRPTEEHCLNQEALLRLH